MGVMDWLGKAASGIGSLFGGGSPGGNSWMSGNATQAAGNGVNVGTGSGYGSFGSGGGSNIMSGLSSLFGGGKGLAGLGMMGIGSMVPNAKAPAMPSQFNDYFSQLKQGGTPGMQSANQYYQGVLSGDNKGAYDAATASLDQSYDEELRKLNSMYKTLRPGTDPSTDSTYQRDLNLLNNNYAKNRANVTAGVQQGAASGAAGVGSQLANMQGGAVQQFVDQIATQWGMNQSQRQSLRDSIMGLGSKMVTGPMDMANQMNWLNLLKQNK